MKRKLVIFLSLVALLCWTTTVSADQFFSFGTPGTGLAASVNFSQVGQDLNITLTNTGGPALVNADILTVLMWNSSVTGLIPSSATGNDLYTDSTTSVPTFPNNVGLNWAYQTPAGNLYGNNQAVSTTGLGGTFAALGTGFFDEPNKETLDGINYGIANNFTGTNIPTSQFPLVADTIVFHLTVPDGYTVPGTITQVTFQYGTSVDEPHHTVPLPGAVLLLGAGLARLAAYARRRKD
jgi:hypothetical protein